MNPKNNKMRIAAVGDIHAEAASTETFLALFAEAAAHADVVALCGDLTATGKIEEAESLAQAISTCPIPVVSVFGNHDYDAGHIEEIKRVLIRARVHVLEDGLFVFKGVTFVGAKGFGGGFGKYMLAPYGENATKAFVNETLQETLLLEKWLNAAETDRIAAILHYAPIPETVKGEPPEIYPFLGSSRFAETLDRYPVSAIFHGHAHHGTLLGKTSKGTPVYNCCKHILERHRPRLPFLTVEL